MQKNTAVVSTKRDRYYLPAKKMGDHFVITLDATVFGDLPIPSAVMDSYLSKHYRCSEALVDFDGALYKSEVCSPIAGEGYSYVPTTDNSVPIGVKHMMGMPVDSVAESEGAVGISPSDRDLAATLHEHTSALRPLHPWLDELLKRALQRTKSITAHISFMYPGTGYLLCMHAIGKHAEVYSKIGGPSRQGVTTLAAKERRAQVISDVRGTKEWQAAMQEAVDCEDIAYQLLLKSFRSEIALPLFGSNKNVIAVLNLHHPKKKGLNRRSVGILKRLCEGASEAIENAIPFETLMESAGWQKEMREAIRRIREQSEAHDTKSRSLYELIVQEGARLARAEVVGMWMHHEPTNELHLASVTAYPTVTYSSFRCLPSHGITRIVFP